MSQQEQEQESGPAVDLIAAIRVTLNEIAGRKLQPNRNTTFDEKHWAVGKLAKDQHNEPPRVDWVEQGGAFEESHISGGNDGSISLDAARYLVTIWHSTAGNCRGTMHNLHLAIRTAAFGPNMTLGGYEFVEDANLKLGRKLRLVVILKLPIATEVHQTVGIEAFGHEVKVGIEQVC